MKSICTRVDGRFHIKSPECNYKEHERQLKEQFITGIGNEEIMQEIIKKSLPPTAQQVK